MFKESKGTKMWKRATGHVPGAYGITSFDKKKIVIDKARHKKQGKHIGYKKNPDGTANLLDTIVHEEMHKAKPKMTERAVVKATKNKVKKLSIKQKSKLYKLYQSKKK